VGKNAAGKSGKAASYDRPGTLAVELVKRLEREGGTVRIVDPDDATRALYRRALHSAKRSGVVPAGHRLLHTGRDRGDLIIRLEADARHDETDWNRIRLSVRDQVTKPD
jgi:hypothetical protein